VAVETAAAVAPRLELAAPHEIPIAVIGRRPVDHQAQEQYECRSVRRAQLSVGGLWALLHGVDQASHTIRPIELCLVAFAQAIKARSSGG
jgi:hypothetical protein